MQINLPKGIQDFAKFKENNLLYVDKTKEILDFIQRGTYIFFSRPRRFGKSLLCSTIKYLYEGRRELFENTYIEDKIDWQTIQRPVIYIDFGSIIFKDMDLQSALELYLENISNHLKVPLKYSTPTANLQYLIQYFSEKDKKPVIIIDEYDKGLTDYLENEQQTIFESNREFLRGFYGIFKSNDAHLHQVIITGISKYGKISIFSQLNNVIDYSLAPQYATICGYTSQELSQYFDIPLQEISKKMNVSKEELLNELQKYYNGYSFDGENTIYNPYSMLNFFELQVFRNYWYDTGTPYFLLKMLKKQKVKFEELEKIKASINVLDMTDILIDNPIAMMFQTGYLTIKKAIQKKFKMFYILDFPNLEVKQAFSQYLLSNYLQIGNDRVSINIASALFDAFEEKKFEKIIEILKNVYSNIPYQIYEKSEAYYHTIFHVTMNSIGLEIDSEVQTNIGRIDSVLFTEEAVFIFEFKLDENEKVALAQIENNQYHLKYKHLALETYLIGINFSSQKRNILSYEVIKIEK
jgi:DNA-binding Lrp family transcriptional regulator